MAAARKKLKDKVEPARLILCVTPLLTHALLRTITPQAEMDVQPTLHAAKEDFVKLKTNARLIPPMTPPVA